MPSINISTDLARDLVAAFRQRMGEQATGLTNAQVLAQGLQDLAQPVLTQYLLQRDLAGLVATQYSAREAAVIAVRDAEEQEKAARMAAKATIEAQVKAELGGIS